MGMSREEMTVVYDEITQFTLFARTQGRSAT